MQPPETRQANPPTTGGAEPYASTDPGVWLQLPDLAPNTMRKPSSQIAAGTFAESQASSGSLSMEPIPATQPVAPPAAAQEQESFLAPDLATESSDQETYYAADYSADNSVRGSAGSQFRSGDSWADNSTDSQFSPLPFPASGVPATGADSSAVEAQLIEAHLIDEANDIAIFLDLERQTTRRDPSVAKAQRNSRATLAADPSSALNVSSVEDEPSDTISFPMPETAPSIGLTGWLARLAPVMILLALIGAATLLLWFLLSGSPEPVFEQGTEDRNSTLGSNDSDSAEKSPSLASSIGVDASEGRGADLKSDGQSRSIEIESKTDSSPKLGSPAGGEPIDLSLQSAWPPKSSATQTPGKSSVPSVAPNRPVMAEFTGTVEPLERVARQPSTERQAKTNSSIPSRQ